jgi:hypothetical protein
MIPPRRLCYRREYSPGTGQSSRDRTITTGKTKQQKSEPADIEDC